MQQLKTFCRVITLGTAFGVWTAVSGPAVAQQAPAPAVTQAPAVAVAPIRPAAERPALRPRDLITPAERQAYRQAIRAAATDQARAQIRADLLTTLRQRAAERGGVLVEPRPQPNREAQNEREGTPGRVAAAPPPRAP
jgi:hypothetical protein